MNGRRYIGARHIHFDATDSTNSRAAEFADEPANAGIVITADLQSQGRGQHGRVWQSPSGANVLLSTLLFPPLQLQRPVILTAFAAVAVAETILQVTGKLVTIKWPNDLLLDGKKVCGILIEGSNKARHVGDSAPFAFSSDPYFVVGIGLNVNLSAADFERMELSDATSLAIALGRWVDVMGVTDTLVESLDDFYANLMAGKLMNLEESWAERIGKIGREVTINLADDNVLQGQLQSLSFDAVTLDLPSGERRQIRPEMVKHLR